MAATNNRIGIRAEDKNEWERRVPLVPDDVRALVAAGIPVTVQSSPIRVFPDSQYLAAGARVASSLDDCQVVVAVKEIPAKLLSPGVAYLFFSHTIKGQSHNMGLLRRVLDVGATLIDYEPIQDGSGQRLTAFGRYAGLAGMIDALWAHGQRLAELGAPNPWARLGQAHNYPNLTEALAAVAQAGSHLGDTPMSAPAVVGITGGGNVARGALEVTGELPHVEVRPEQLSEQFLAQAPRDRVLVVRFSEEHTVAPADGGAFELTRYQSDPSAHRSIFAQYLPYLTVLVNAIVWDHRAPRLVTRQDLLALGQNPKLTLIADLSCDINGGIEATVRATDPGDPVFVYDPATGQAPGGFAGPGFAVLAVDNLPCELPAAASEGFSGALAQFVPALAATDFTAAFDQLALPEALKNAVIAHQGQLTPRFGSLGAYLGATQAR